MIKACKLCGAEFESHSHYCDDCRKIRRNEYERRYKYEHRELLNAKQRRYRERHREKINEYSREWRRRQKLKLIREILSAAKELVERD